MGLLQEETNSLKRIVISWTHGSTVEGLQKSHFRTNRLLGEGQSHFQGHRRRRSHYSKIAYCQCTGDVGTYRMCLRASTTTVPMTCSVGLPVPKQNLGEGTGSMSHRQPSKGQQYAAKNRQNGSGRGYQPIM